MKKTFIIANWKSNKTIYQAKEWFRTFNNSQLTINKEEKEVIICPSFTLLPFVKESIVKNQLSIAVGVQNISQFDEGAYTGEVNGKQIKEYADYVIIGHSERRLNLHEDNEILEKKIEMARKYNIMPIFCIQDKATQVPKDVEIVAYEPVFAIGTGNPDTPENANDVASFFKNNHKAQYVLYGGSVTSENVRSFTEMSHMDGVLIGKASLDVKEFSEIIKNA